MDTYNIDSYKDIIKNEIDIMCKLLNNRNEYKNICIFEPENIIESKILLNSIYKCNYDSDEDEEEDNLIEGAIIYKFIKNKEWYKTIRISIYSGDISELVWKYNNSMIEWSDNSDEVVNKNRNMKLFLKVSNGAPVFTEEELKIWEECYNKINK